MVPLAVAGTSLWHKTMIAHSHMSGDISFASPIVQFNYKSFVLESVTDCIRSTVFHANASKSKKKIVLREEEQCAWLPCSAHLQVSHNCFSEETITSSSICVEAHTNNWMQQVTWGLEDKPFSSCEAAGEVVSPQVRPGWIWAYVMVDLQNESGLIKKSNITNALICMISLGLDFSDAKLITERCRFNNSRH